MDSPIAPASMRRGEDGPAYDLLSLGIVTLTILVIAVWTTHYFEDSARNAEDFKFVRERSDRLSLEENLKAAKWADFNLRMPGGNDISPLFCDHLSEALAQETRERDWLRYLTTHGSDEERASAKARLLPEDDERPNGKSSPDQDDDGPVHRYAARWYQLHSEWIEARDTRNFDVGAHLEFMRSLLQVGMEEEAAGGVEISPSFLARLKTALEIETRKRTSLERRAKSGTIESVVAAKTELLDLDSRVRRFAREWYQVRSGWLERRDLVKFDVNAHKQFEQTLADLGMHEEAIAENKRVRSAIPDWPERFLPAE